MARSLVMLALAGAAVAQSTVDLLLPMADPQVLRASIVSADASLTTYFVTCPTSVPADECGLPVDGLSITQGPSSWIMTYTVSDPEEPATYSQEAHCKLDLKKDVASCSMTLSASVSGEVTTTSTETIEAGIKTAMVPVTVTAGDAAPAPAKTSSTAPETSEAPASKTSSDEIVASDLPTGSSSGDEALTLATRTSSSTGSAASTPASSAPADSAAGHVGAQYIVLTGVAALVGALML